jgi:stage V sporulation protein K
LLLQFPRPDGTRPPSPDLLLRPEELVRRGVLAPGAAIEKISAERSGYLADPAQAAAAEPLDRALRIRQILAELDELIGLEKVKEIVREVRAFISIQQRRREAGLRTEPLVLHMVFRGNPGTGKTTVARILGKVFREMGVLSQGHLLEVERADLVGEYIGHTAQKTREQLRKAEGGILFIDEAYALARGGDKDFGKEAIDTLVKAMEDMKDRLVLILAGYQHEMARFLDANPGLRSRFPIHIEFPDFSLGDLMKIAAGMLAKREYRLSETGETTLSELLAKKLAEETRNAGNARLVRNLIEAAIRRQAVRLVVQAELTRDQLMTIESEDLPGG